MKNPQGHQIISIACLLSSEIFVTESSPSVGVDSRALGGEYQIWIRDMCICHESKFSTSCQMLRLPYDKCVFRIKKLLI